MSLQQVHPDLPSDPASSPSQEQPTTPHGYLTAFVVVLSLSIAAIIGLIWLNTLLPPKPNPRIYVILMGLYALFLLVPFGAVAVLLRREGFALWRGIALTLALAGGHALLVGAVMTVDLSLRWPGLPVLAPTLASLIFSLGVILAGRRLYLGRPDMRIMVLGLALGLLVSTAWVVVGALGNLIETLIAPVDALASGLFGAILVTTPFFYEREMPARRPFWSAVLAGLIFLALQIGLLAGRGYWLQGNLLVLAMLLLGFAAGSLLTLGPQLDLSRRWWAAAGFLFAAYLLPLTWTEGFEGDFLFDEMLFAWLPAVPIELLMSVALGATILIARRQVGKLTTKWLMPAGLSLLSLVVVTVAYLAFGQPGLQPDIFFVVMADQADTTFARQIADREERARAVYETLTEHALRTQADLRAFLDGRRVTYTPYYLVNGLEVEGDPLLRWQIARRSDVAYILNSPHTRPLPSSARSINLPPEQTEPPGTPTWGISQMGAESVWEQLGVTGEGIVVGSADSGVDWTHPALRDQYLGSAGGHDYTWFDPWYGTSEPTDANGHGTHTLGTILGQGGIGVAPGARWIACRNLARNLGNLAYYLDCMQFLLAPHPQNGDPFTQGDPSRGAHVTNNSWGCPPQEGCDISTLDIAIQHLRNAGQMFVVGAGNEGPGCATIWSPASADAAFSVGAVDMSGQIASFSSRGPILADDSGRVKPDVVAPGVDVLSALPGGGYARLEGTSMAGPHVTGLVALLWSANPALIGDIDTTEQIITGTAHPTLPDDLCGATNGNQNNVYGFGFIDARAAVEMALEMVGQ